MPKIIKVKYDNEAELQIRIFFDDKEERTQPHNSERYQYTKQLNKWLDAGGVIEPWKTQSELALHNKAKARKAINKKRGVDFNKLSVEFIKNNKTHVIDAHEKAISALNNAVISILLSRSLGEPDKTISWTSAADNDIELTYDEVIEISQLAYNKRADIHQQSRIAKKALP